MISRQQGIAFTEDPSCAVAKASAKNRCLSLNRKRAINAFQV
jgi:hypothetical protein